MSSYPATLVTPHPTRRRRPRSSIPVSVSTPARVLSLFPGLIILSTSSSTPHKHQRHLGFLFSWALHSSTSTHGTTRFIGYIEQDILAFFFLSLPSPIIDTPPIAGLAVGAGIHTPSPVARDLLDPRLRRARGGRPSDRFPVYLIPTRIGLFSISPCVITSRLPACFRTSTASHFPRSPPPPSALPGRSSY